jgi:hypothetical protein
MFESGERDDHPKARSGETCWKVVTHTHDPVRTRIFFLDLVEEERARWLRETARTLASADGAGRQT